MGATRGITLAHGDEAADRGAELAGDDSSRSGEILTSNPDRTSDLEKNTDPPAILAILSGCKAWVVSTGVHLIIIIVLAIITTSVADNTQLSLEIESDQTESFFDTPQALLDASTWEQELTKPTLNNQQHVPELLLNDLPETTTESLQDVMGADPFAGSGSSTRMLTRSDASHPNSSFFGIQAAGNRIIYVVDRSGSMWGSRWRDARAELIQSIEQLNSDQEFYVYLFSRKCITMPAYAGRGNMVPATRQNIEKAKEWLMKQKPDGHTYPLSAVQRALRMEPHTIFLLTDGNFQDGTGRFLIDRALARQHTSQADKLVVNTIAFHCDVGLEMLRQIAVANSGTFRHVE